MSCALIDGATSANGHQDWFEPADGTQNHFEGSKSQQKFQDARAATLKQWSSGPPSSKWKGGAELGAGAFGAAWVWYHVDAQGIIFDRMAVKDTALRRDQWVSRTTIPGACKLRRLTPNLRWTGPDGLEALGMRKIESTWKSRSWKISRMTPRLADVSFSGARCITMNSTICSRPCFADVHS